jgi:Tol biopolymer transport system component
VSSWSPDGATLFFFGTAEREGNIWAKSISSGKEFAVTDFRGRRGNMIRSTLATDGAYLYFVWGEYESDIWVMDVVTDEGE